MKLILEKITLLNFQGIKDLEIKFSDKITSIHGANGTGKTTIANAITYLHFGKTLNDRANFEIKTLDENNVVIPMINHEVEGIYLKDNENLNLKRVYREKYTRKKGSKDPVFDGNTEDYFINSVPVPQTQYVNFVNSLIVERLFKLLSNPIFFNHHLDMKAKRTMLLEMSGGISYSSIQGFTPEFVKIISTKSIEGYKKEIKAIIDKLNDQLKQIPTRIDEVSRTIPEVIPNPDLDLLKRLEAELADINDQVKIINNQNQERIQTATRLSREYSALIEKKNKLIFKSQEDALKTNRENSRVKDELNMSISHLKGKVQVFTDYIKRYNDLISEDSKEIELLNQKGAAIEAETIPTDLSILACPTCERPYSTEKINESVKTITQRFNEGKVKRFEQLYADIAAVNKRIQDNKIKLQEYEEKKKANEPELKELETKFEQIKNFPIAMISSEDILGKSEEYKTVLNEISNKELEISSNSMHSNTFSQAETEHNLINQIDAIKKDIRNLDLITMSKNRIEALNKEKAGLGIELAETETILFEIERFNKAYMMALDDKVSSMFDGGVRFRMFRQLTNGGEEDDCTLIYKGVPYPDLNNAAKIQVGIHCINTFSRAYNLYPPIIVDNAESVTSLPYSESQIIRFVVNPIADKLTVFND